MFKKKKKKIKALGVICSVGCPPTPRSIVDKIAFHPPTKEKSYQIFLEEAPEQPLADVSMVHAFVFQKFYF